MSAPEKITALRDLLSRRFPQAGASERARCVPSGVPTLDEAAGGLPCGAITEVVCTVPSCGGWLLLGRVLETCRAHRLRVALIDGAGTFDPQSFVPDLLPHLVWVRPENVKQVLQAADLLARDANFGLVVVDVRSPRLESEFRQEPPTSWYRLQRAAEQTDLPLLVETPRPLVPSAQLRFVLEQPQPVAALQQERPRLAAQLSPRLQRQRRQTALSS